MPDRKPFYGWYLVGFTCICYGLGITPAYVTWGIVSETIIGELDFSRGQTGAIFGLFTFLYSAVGPLCGYLQGRIGIRTTMTGGALLAAFGAFMAARADTMWDFLLFFSICGGGGIGLSTIVPAQTIAQNWFLKNRAKAIAIIFASGGVVGFVWPRFVLPGLLDAGGWRFAFTCIGWVSVVIAALCWAAIRDTPEALGQNRDGKDVPPPAPDNTVAAFDPDTWTAAEAMRTPQFLLIVLCGIAYALPWGVVAAHGALHLGDLGYTRDYAAALIGMMFLVSIAGRLSGSLGDWVNPRHVLAIALVLEALGTGGLLIANTPLVARILFVMIGLGFGAAYVSIPVVFADFFGRRAFATTSGTRLLITGVFNALAPYLSGEAYDRLQSYAIPFITLMILGLIGAVAAFLCPKPVHHSQRE